MEEKDQSELETTVGTEDSTESTEQSASSHEEPSESAPESGEPNVPEKFKGKSTEEVIKAYSESEKRFHQIASERSELNRRLEEQQARLDALQLAISSRAQSQPQHEVVEQDPFADIEKQIAEDPIEAMRKLVAHVKEQPKRMAEGVNASMRQQQAQAVYEKKKAENPDFVEREGDMSQLAKQYAHLIRPEHLNSPETIEILDLMSRGRKVEKYVKDAEEKARKERDVTREAKRQAFSESSNSRGDVSTELSVDDFAGLSHEKQQAELRRLEKKLGIGSSSSD